MLAPTGRCIAGLGAACVVLSAFMPFAYTQRGAVINQFDHGLINYRQGWILLGLAALGLIGIVASYVAPWKVLLAPLLFVVTGIAANVYAASIRDFDFLNLCVGAACRLHVGPTSSIRAEPQASVAFSVAGIGGLLLVAGGIVLAFGPSRRGLMRRPVIERTRPLWM